MERTKEEQQVIDWLINDRKECIEDIEASETAMGSVASIGAKIKQGRVRIEGGKIIQVLRSAIGDKRELTYNLFYTASQQEAAALHIQTKGAMHMINGMVAALTGLMRSESGKLIDRDVQLSHEIYTLYDFQ